MRFVDHLSEALANLRRRKLRSFLTISAVVVGAMSVIVMLTLVLGVKRAFVKQINSMDALTLVSVSGDPSIANQDAFRTNGPGDGTGKKLGDADVRTLRALPHVVAAAPVGSIWVKSIQLEGGDKRLEAGVTTYDPSQPVLTVPIAAGRGLRDGDLASIVLSMQAARRLSPKGAPGSLVGKTLLLGVDGWSGYNDWTGSPPKPPENADKEYWDKLGNTMKTIPADIVGIGAPGMNDGTNYITLAWARKLMTQRRWEWDDAARKKWEQRMQQAKAANEPFAQPQPPSFLMLVREDLMAKQGYGAVQLRADSADNVARVAAEVERLGYGASTAQAMLDQIGKVFVLLGLIAGAIGGISLFVAGIGIVNTMVMAALERTREVGVMRACGATRSTIRRMFALEAALIGAIGGALALLACFGIGQIGNVILDRVAQKQSIPLSGVIAFPAWLVAGVLGLTASVGLLSGLVPAQRAARMDPVAALRYE